jgi:hypothetical protein
VNRVSTEEVLNKAYRLAYFLHQDKGMAIRIVAAATLKLNVAMAAQSKRLYYVPVGRFSRGESRRTDGIRNKALFSDHHLLQRLIYVESEPYERQKEHAAIAAPPGVRADGDPASDEDLLVYFIKHLVRITTKRNAFYVTLGVSRLLHSYSTVETMEIYNAVIGEPERVKDDYYYRSRKAVLMHEMYQRFDQLIRVCRQVPRDFDPLKSIIASLTSNSSADENEVEVNRIHAILHPDCFERLVSAFGYSPPEERMELPRFFSSETNDQSPPGQRSAPAELSAEELAEISHMLDEQAGRRRRSSPTGVVRIMVDGIERGRLNPAEQSSISFTVEEDAEIVEVKTVDQGGDLLLATHLLTSFENDVVSSIRLEGGQELSLSITRRQIAANGGTDFLVQFGYRETDPRRAARLWWRRLSLRLSAEQGPRVLWGWARISVLAGSVIVICLASYLAYVKLRPQQTSGPISVQTTPLVQTPSPEAGTSVNEKTNQPDKVAAKPTPRTKIERSANVSSSPATEPQGAVSDEDVAADATRSGNVVPNLTLKEIKKVYIEVRGDAALDEIRSNLVKSLGSSGVIAPTNAAEADAALKIVIRGGPQIEASAILVNARGTVLWRGARRYSGEIPKVTSDIVNDLLSEIR